MRKAALIAYTSIAMVSLTGACGRTLGDTTESGIGGTSSTSGVAGGNAASPTSQASGDVSGANAVTGAGGFSTSTGVIVTTGAGGASTVTNGSGGMGTTVNGAGGGPAGCPATIPTNMSACPGMQGDVCAYGATECNCGGGMMWRCHTCPAAEPMTGAACMGNGTTCAFGTTDCTCAGGQWSCGTCPATLPVNGTACTSPDIDCGYGGTDCLCTPPGGPMGGNRWRCNAPCPPTQPNPGDTCSTLRMTQCPYAGTTCLCIGGQFFCD
jgi:hypothetical protein